MGKIFESLKRRDQAHDPSAERVAAFAPAAGAKAIATGLTHADGDAVEIQIPFVEWPEDTAEVVATPAAVKTAPKATVVEPTNRAEIAFQALRPTLSRNGIIAPELAVWRDPNGPLANFYHQVGGSLHDILAQEKVRSLLLIPIGGGAGLKAAIANLALVFAEKCVGNVLLIDAAPGNRGVAALFGLATAPGWSELLTGVALSQLVQDSGVNKLHILAAGNRLVHARGELVQHRVQTLVEGHGLVLLAGSEQALPVAPSLIAHACHASCLVLAKDDADPGLLQRSMDAFADQRLRLLGAVTVEGSG